MNSDQLISIIEFLTKAISGDDSATVQSLPQVGREQTLVLAAPGGIGRLLGKGGGTFKALCRVAGAASWSTGVSVRLVINDPRNRIEETEKSDARESSTLRS